jgi:histidine triad (HIT) family protein
VAADGCLFCRIAAGEIPSERIAEGDGVLAFRDISPRAPVHVLVVPERHVGSADELTDDAEDVDLLARCYRLAREVARVEGIADGYRITTNVGEKGGQSVHHLHFHVLGGRQLGHIDSGSPEAPA